MTNQPEVIEDVISAELEEEFRAVTARLFDRGYNFDHLVLIAMEEMQNWEEGKENGC